MKFLSIILIILINFLHAECKVNGYYKANGTWVNGYTRSGDCWHGKIKNYDSKGRSDEDRVKERRKFLPFYILVYLILIYFYSKLKENTFF